MEARRAGIVWWLSAIVAVIVVVAGVVVWSRHRAAAPSAVEPATPITRPVAVSTVTVRSAKLARWSSVVGTLIARNQVTVAAEGGGGRITELLVDVGDQVAAGQPVIVLDSTAALTLHARAEASRLRAVAMVRQQEALIAEAQAALSDATAAARRVEALGSGVASVETVEQRRTSVATATARLAAAEQALEINRAEVALSDAQVRDATLAVERTTLRAPAGGTVLIRQTHLGAVVNPGDMLLQLAQDGIVEFAAEVTEDVLPLVQVGQPVELDAGGISATGVVRRVAPSLDPATRLGEVRITLTASEKNTTLRPGLSARGRIQVATGEGPVVPTSALLDDGAGTVVMIVAEGHARRRPVSKVLRAGAETLIGEGVAVGEAVIARAPNFVPDGEAVLAIPQAVPEKDH